MASKNQSLWIIYFVGFDDTITESDAAELNPFVGKEAIDVDSDDSEQIMAQARLAAFLRGGELLAVIEMGESQAELIRAETEAALLRQR